jgi:hypothetical protein
MNYTIERMKPIAPNSLDGYRDKAIQRMIDAFYATERPSDKTLFKIGRSLHDVRVRDVAVWHICHMPQDDLQGVGKMAFAIVNLMHPDDQAPLITVSAIAAWLDDSPLAAALFLYEALSIDPDYSLAQLMSTALVSGMPATSWAETMQELTLDTVRYGR